LSKGVRDLETIEYKGEIYTRRNAKWIDSRHLVVCETLQRVLNLLYLEQLDYSQYSTRDLVVEGDKFKESSSYQSAISFYEKALEDCDEVTHQYILPRITSCYRKNNMPRKVIDLFSETKRKYGTDFITPVLLTSVAAAYCDLKEYENALRCCKWAYKTFGEFNPNLSNVYARIKKESGLE
jgi:tetratricopeptide (TPR) repeat protein